MKLALILVASLVGPPSIYPPPSVPGKADPAMTAQMLCAKGFKTETVRPPASYTNTLKFTQMMELHLAGKPSDYEEDHLISLELGGDPKSPQNLWPEPYTTSVPDGGAKSKDIVENYLHAQVCAGKIALSEAQREIATDWYAVLKRIGK